MNKKHIQADKFNHVMHPITKKCADKQCTVSAEGRIKYKIYYKYKEAVTQHPCLFVISDWQPQFGPLSLQITCSPFHFCFHFHFARTSAHRNKISAPQAGAFYAVPVVCWLLWRLEVWKKKQPEQKTGTRSDLCSHWGSKWRKEVTDTSWCEWKSAASPSVLQVLLLIHPQHPQT